MKKKSIKDLDGLKKRGWKISEEDHEKLSDKKSKLELNKSISKIAESVGGFADITKEIQKQNTETGDRFELLIGGLFSNMEKTIREHKPQFERPRKWHFKVVRNNKQFITDVIATAGDE